MEEHRIEKIRYDLRDILIPFRALRHFPEIRREESSSERAWEYFTSSTYALTCSSLYAMVLSEWLTH